MENVSRSNCPDCRTDRASNLPAQQPAPVLPAYHAMRRPCAGWALTAPSTTSPSAKLFAERSRFAIELCKLGTGKGDRVVVLAGCTGAEFSDVMIRLLHKAAMV